MAADRPALPLWVRILIALCCVVEAALWINPDVGLGVPLRTAANVVGAFWAPVLETGQELYQGQTIAMFLTYGLLHGGLAHLGMNMFSLAAVGAELARFLSPVRMAFVYLASQIVAALAYALISATSAPMVGASGAIFGLAGALIAQAVKWRRHNAMSMRPIWRAVLIIGGLNLALTFAVPNIAWQAHLGGVLAGFALGFILPLRRDMIRAQRSRFPTVDSRKLR